LVPIALPKSSFGQFAPALNAPAQTFGMINANAKDPVSIIKYIDFLNKESVVKTLKWGIEGEHYKLNDKGCSAPIDAEKNKKELDYNPDYSMVSSTGEIYGKCDPRLAVLDLNNPVHKEIKDILDTARKVYIDPKTPMPGFFLVSPSLPSELNLILQSVSKMADEYTKSIVTPDYSAEMAGQAAKGMWTKAGGAKIEEYLTDYYKKNKDNIVTVMDLYEKK